MALSWRIVGSNIAQFVAETNREIAKLQKKQVSTAKEIIIGAWADIVEESPKDTGLFRHSNFITKNFKYKKEIKPPKSEDDRKALAREHEDKQESQKAKIEISRLKHGDVITIQNNLSYADRIEGGHSKIQAPFGVYGIVEEKVRKEIGRTITIK